MWLASIVSGLVLAAGVPAAGGPATGVPAASKPAAADPAAPASPAPLYTRQMLFAIPFRVEHPAQPSEEPVEVQLYVSGDRGATWHLYSRTNPARGQFLFRAGADGEFWFYIRAVGRGGQMVPRNSNAPELKVIVDTAPPKVQLDARRGDAGQIVVRWQAEDRNLKPDGLVIQYRAANEQTWQPVAIGPQDRRPLPQGAGQTGEIALVAPPGATRLEFRPEASDMAGNPAVAHAQVDLTAARPVAIPAQGGAPAATATAQKPPVKAVDGEPWQQGQPDPPHTAWPPTAVGPSATPVSDRPAPGTVPPYGPLRPAPADGNPATNPARPATTPTQPPPANVGAVVAPVSPPIGNQFIPPQAPGNGDRPSTPFISSSSSAAAAGPLAGLPRGERPRMVNAKSFALEYDVESVGPAGIKQVELWGTSDGGQTWRSYAVVAGQQSPIAVSVDKEGLYGFRLVMQTGTGLTGRLPRSGDLPEISIGVDVTKPTARLTAVPHPAAGNDAGKLEIAWEASDNMLLAARPVALSIAPAAAGPWTPIAAGLENTGRYLWPIDSRAPGQVFVRLEVRDEAGNVAVCDWPSPVVLDRPQRSLRIRNVQPLDAAGKPVR